MSTEAQLLDRMRDNLQAAGIPASEEDLEEVHERGFLSQIATSEEYLRTVPSDQIPDSLSAWGEDLPEQAARGEVDHANLKAGSLFGSPGGDPAIEPLRYMSILDVRELLAQRKISVVDLVHATIERISERDPVLNAFQSVLSERALKAARRADQEIEAGIDLGPLHGVPIAAKDLLAMRGTITTAGSLIYAGRRTDYDATVIERLEEAGAIIVGKTRMPEFAFSPGSNNEHYGPTRNPWNYEHDTGGSSSGSGAAVADGLVYGALGSDTGGSIRIPAALCGVVGFKPTFGRVSLHGADPLSWSLDHLGPMTRTVMDAALMMNVLGGVDARDPRTRKVPEPDYTADLHRGIKGMRIGVLTDDGSAGALADDDALASWHQSLRYLRDQGVELVDISLPEMEDIRKVHLAVIRVEAAAAHEPNMVAGFEQLSRFLRHRVMAGYAHSPLAAVQSARATAYLRQKCQRIWNSVDLLCTPAMPYEAPMIGDPARNTAFTGAFNLLGWPAAVVPISLNNNRLPLSTQLVGRPWEDVRVLQVANALEAARGTVR